MEHYPLLSCWESQGEGVDESAERSEAGLDRLDMRERDQGEPGQEQTGTDVGLQQQAQVVEVMLPTATRVPSGMGLHRSGRWERGGGVVGCGVGGGGRRNGQ